MINPQTRETTDFPDDGHVAIVGRTRCGKTNLVALPLIAHSVRKGRLVMFIDPSGAPATVHQVRLIAEANGRRFRFLSTVDALDTEFIDVFQDRPYSISDVQLAGTLLEGAGVHRGGGYGKAHFTDACAAPACQVMASLREQRIPRTVTTISEHLRRLNLNARGMDHIANATQILTHFRCLAEPGPERRRIVWHDCYDNKDVIYIHCPTRNSPQSAKAAMLIHQSLITYLDARHLFGNKPDRTDIFIDEASYFLTQATASDVSSVGVIGVRYVFLTQSIEQFDLESKMIGQIVLDNCATTLWFTPFSEREATFIQRHSGQAKYWLESRTTGPAGVTTSVREDRDYKVTEDDILRVAQANQCAILVRRVGENVSEPLPVWMDFTLPAHEFARLENTGLQLAQPDEPTPIVERHGPHNPLKDNQWRERAERLAAMFHRLNRARTGDTES